ncbi:Zinc-finger homeodomain protein [Quillaja saponaria]|uniref:Zinc-finger homeodomain protein n=1 Tax=Quillaja saponaria TaxID=32244 RepID=A0AAD7KIZ2_QUISA|nr:Zinc-finger homeodomain protein [Quillaja saponaria]
MASTVPTLVSSSINIVTTTFEQTIVYKECKRNHALALNYVSIDGCVEFIKAGQDGAKEAFTSRACGCHRNFHRKEIIYAPIMPTNTFVNSGSAPTMQLPHATHSDGGERRPQLDVGVRRTAAGPRREAAPGPRRRRTKTVFTEEQKERLLSFAQRLGWEVALLGHMKLLNSSVKKWELRDACYDVAGKQPEKEAA